MEPQERSIDKAAQEMIGRMAEAGQKNVWDRLDAQSPQCGFGKQGICCRICTMGPCRISKNPFRWARKTWWIGRPVLRPFCLTGKEFPSQVQELMALAAPRALMNISALNDCFYSKEEKDFTGKVFDNMAMNVRKVFQLYGKDSNFACITHLDGHSFKESCREKAYAVLEKHLKE